VSNPPVTLMLRVTESMPGEPYQYSDSAATRHCVPGSVSTGCSASWSPARSTTAPRDGSRRHTVFDLVPVMRHAWRSWYLAPGLQVAIVGCLVLGSRLAGALVVCVIFVCLMLRVAARIIAETFRAQVLAVAEDWFERRKFRIRPETPGSRTRDSRFYVQLPPEKVPGSDHRAEPGSEV